MPQQFTLPKETLELLTDRLSDEQIATQYSVAKSTIYLLRRRLDVRSYSTKTSCRVNRKTGETLNPGEGTPSGRLALQRSDYFDSIDTEGKAYFLGLIIADGHVRNTARDCYFAIELQDPDSKVLESLRAELNIQKPLEHLVRPGKKDAGRIRVYSRQLVKGLLSKGKTLNTETSGIFRDLDPSLRRHFVRGVIDGDGSIRSKGKSFYVGTCAIDLLLGIQEWISLEATLDTQFRMSKRTLPSGKTFYRLDFTQATSLVRWLYEDSSFFIDRKKEEAAIWLSRFSAGALVSPLPSGLDSGVSR